MKYTNNPDHAAQRLEHLSNYEGSELGEVWSLLARLWESYQDYISTDFAEALQKEIIDEAERTHREFKLVETPVEIEAPRTRTELKYIGE